MRYILDGNDLYGSGLPQGGSSGYMLQKNSSTDGDALWKSPAEVRDNLSVVKNDQIAYIENGNTSSRSYVIGDYLLWKGVLYRVKSTIASSGVTLSAGGNLESVSTSVGKEISKLNQSLTSMLTVEYVRPSSATTIPTNAEIAVNIDVTKSGYTPLGIVGWSLANRINLVVTGVLLSSLTTATIYGVNFSTETSLRPAVYVLYKKN